MFSRHDYARHDNGFIYANAWETNRKRFAAQLNDNRLKKFPTRRAATDWLTAIANPADNSTTHEGENGV